MTDTSGLPPEMQDLAGREVVIDCRGPFIYIGRLETVGADCLVLTDVDVHHKGESNTGTDLYLIQSRKHGVRANRTRAYVLSREVSSISLLADIIPY